MNPTTTLLLTRDDVKQLLSLGDCVDAVGRAFALAAQGLIPRAGVLGFPAKDGGFHMKVASLSGNPGYFAAKLNGNFFHNRERFGMPNIQGLIVLCDSENGRPLAVMDSIEITILRTGAATGVAARELARKNATTVMICGCGNQGRVSLRALQSVMRIERLYLWDIDPQACANMAAEFGSTVSGPTEVVGDPRTGTRASDVIVTCTPAKKPFLASEDVRAGAFIAAVGADNEEKSEVGPTLMAASTIVTDSTEQCVKIGDLHHAIEAGLATAGSVHAEIGQILAGQKAGRTREDEIIIFDSTGTALQDVAAAALVYERAVIECRGTPFAFAT
jgi:alanine dehydrogenase